MREIDDILNFRTDISPFLVHLTRNKQAATATATSPGIPAIFAKDVLAKILADSQLIPSCTPFSDAKFGLPYPELLAMDSETKCRFFGAISFTETPISQIHCLLEIAARTINLQPYGLVFLKQRLRERGVGPIFYFNNEIKDKDPVMQALCSLIGSHPEVAEIFLPMISNFGQRITSPNAAQQTTTVDFLWEREWRLPSRYGAFGFTSEDVFVGLCPHDEITKFEGYFPGVGFIDPLRSMSWYATKLIDARQRLNLKASVV